MSHLDLNTTRPREHGNCRHFEHNIALTTIEVGAFNGIDIGNEV